MQNNAMISEENLDCFKVYVRIRPLSEKENLSLEKIYSNTKTKKYPKSILVKEDNLLFVLDPDSLDYNIKGRKEKSFVFDDIYEENHNNYYIFDNVIRNNIDNVLKGFNSTALAYGVTGTGKTHTIFGDMQSYITNYDNENITNNTVGNIDNANIPTNKIQKDNYEIGVCVHAVDYLFSQIEFFSEKNFLIKISYLEIYNEQVIDLLVERSSGLMIVEDTQKGVVVPDLSELNVNNSSELIKLIIEGNSRRTMAATGQNLFSSRSHAILQIIVEQHNKIKDIKEEYFISKFLLVDLAGSERGGLEKGIRTHEGKNINKSLLSLGNCINILSDKSKKGAFVPYRDSKLTRLLKDSLGGNIMTVMIACVSPSPISYDETVNTLKYAMRARKIEKKITKNIKEIDVHISQYKEIIDSLKSEIGQLKQVIKEQQVIIHGSNNSIVDNLAESQEIKIIEENLMNNRQNMKEIEEENNNNFEDKEDRNNYLIEKNKILENSKNLEIDENFSNKEKKNNEKPDNFNEKKFFSRVSFISGNENNNKLTANNKNNSNIKILNNNYNTNQGNQGKLYFNYNILELKKNNSNFLSAKNSNSISRNEKNKNISIQNTTKTNKTSYVSINKNRNIQNKKLNDSNCKNFTKQITSDYNINDNTDNINNNYSPNSIIVKDLDISGYRSFLQKNCEEEYNLDELEKHVENLQNDKILIENLIEKGNNNDKNVTEKYKMIKSCYEKYLDYINDKLIQNIEESMILKFNLKEILDLNIANNSNINLLNSQINNLERIFFEKENENKAPLESEITKLREEIKNIQTAIVENDGIKEKIAESLKKNIRFKSFLKKILLKLISRTQKKETNLEEAYIKIIKEKEDLELKNKTYEKHLTNIIKEKQIKDSKLGKVQDEIIKLKKILEEKDKLIKNISNSNTRELNKVPNRGREISKQPNKKSYASKSLEKENIIFKKLNIITTKEHEDNNFNNLTVNYEENMTEAEKIEINLQDEYKGTKKKFINDINHFSSNILIDENENIKNINNENAENAEINFEEILKNNTNVINNANIQNIKYIINQTNNIVNNNINKVIEKDLKNKQNLIKKNFSSINKITSEKNISNKTNFQNKIKIQDNNPAFNRKTKVLSQQKYFKANSTVSNNFLDFCEEKILNENNFIKNLESLSNKVKSPRNINSNQNVLFYKKKENFYEENNLTNKIKLEEFDKIIENQLNEVYNKKAKEIGDRMKKKFKNNSTNFLVNTTANNKMNLNNKNKNNLNEKENNNKVNKSLSISCVSINNEIGFYSELDIVDQIDDKGNFFGTEKNNLNKINNNNNNLFKTSSSKIGNLFISDNLNKENILENKTKEKKENIYENINNKKMNMLINPSPIKLTNNFVGNFINQKKSKPINLDYKTTNIAKNTERFINSTKDLDKKINKNINNNFSNLNSIEGNKKLNPDNHNIDNFISNFNEYQNILQLSPKFENINNKVNNQNLNSKETKSSNSLIPLVTMEISNKNKNFLLNSHEIKDFKNPLFNNEGNHYNTNSNKINNINVQKFINISNNSSIISNSNKNTNNSNNKKNKKIEKEVNENDKNKINSGTKFFNNLYDLNNVNVNERSPSLLKKARMERKKNNDIRNNDKHNKENNESKNLKSNFFIDNNSSRNNNSIIKQRNKQSASIGNHSNHSNNELIVNKKRNFETNLVRKGSNISKNSVDFVNDYIIQKKNLIESKNNNDRKKKNMNSKNNSTNMDNSKILHLSSLRNSNKNILNVQNDLNMDDLDFENTSNIKAIFVHRENDEENLISEKINIIEIPKFESNFVEMAQEKTKKKGNSTKNNLNLSSDLYKNLVSKNQELISSNNNTHENEDSFDKNDKCNIFNFF